MKVSRSDMFSKYPRASFSSIRSSSCMCHQLVSSHDPDASRTRLWAPDLTHPRSSAVSCRRTRWGLVSRRAVRQVGDPRFHCGRLVSVKSLSGSGQGEDCCCRPRAVLHAGTTRSTSLPVIGHAWCQATDQSRRGEGGRPPIGEAVPKEFPARWGGVDGMKASLDKTPGRPLTGADLCDRCSSGAVVETVMTLGGSLLWCALHFAFFEDALNAHGATIAVDERRQ